MEGAITGGGEQSNVEGSDFRWRGAIAGRWERLLVEGSDHWWRGAIAGGLAVEPLSIGGQVGVPSRREA